MGRVAGPEPSARGPGRASRPRSATPSPTSSAFWRAGSFQAGSFQILAGKNQSGSSHQDASINQGIEGVQQNQPGRDRLAVGNPGGDVEVTEVRQQVVQECGQPFEEVVLCQ